MCHESFVRAGLANIATGCVSRNAEISLRQECANAIVTGSECSFLHLTLDCGGSSRGIHTVGEPCKFCWRSRPFHWVTAQCTPLLSDPYRGRGGTIRIFCAREKFGNCRQESRLHWLPSSPTVGPDGLEYDKHNVDSNPCREAGQDPLSGPAEPEEGKLFCRLHL